MLKENGCPARKDVYPVQLSEFLHLMNALKICGISFSGLWTVTVKNFAINSQIQLIHFFSVRQWLGYVYVYVYAFI